MTEIWLKYKFYENEYLVSNKGEVKNIKGHSMSPYITKQGYLQVSLRSGDVKKQVKVHRMVAQVFLENPECKPYVNHKDGIKTNNKLENLEWCTAKENTQHAIETGLYISGGFDCGLAKVSRETRELMFNMKASGIKVEDIATQLSLGKTTVNRHIRAYKREVL